MACILHAPPPSCPRMHVGALQSRPSASTVGIAIHPSVRASSWASSGTGSTNPRWPHGRSTPRRARPGDDRFQCKPRVPGGVTAVNHAVATHAPASCRGSRRCARAAIVAQEALARCRRSSPQVRDEIVQLHPGAASMRRPVSRRDDTAANTSGGSRASCFSLSCVRCLFMGSRARECAMATPHPRLSGRTDRPGPITPR